MLKKCLSQIRLAYVFSKFSQLHKYASMKKKIFFTKDVVKKIAETSGFERIAKKRESMGICFIGKRKNGFAEFIQARLFFI